MPLLGSSAVGLTVQGARDAVGEHVDPVDGPRGPRTKTRLSLNDMLRALVVAEDVLDADDLLTHRRVPGFHDPDQGAYGERSGRAWWADVGRPALLGIPGVERVEREGAPDTVRFDGADPAVLLGGDVGDDDDRTDDLATIRETPRAAAERTLDARGVPRHSDRHAQALRLFGRIQAAGADGVTTDALAGALPRDGTDALEDDLAAIPGVTCTVDDPDPEDFPVETMADVKEAEARLDAGAVEVWTYAGA